MWHSRPVSRAYGSWHALGLASATLLRECLVFLSGPSSMSDQNTATKAGFQNAEAYERLMGRWSRRLAPLLIRFGGLSDGDQVLDVGCGTGSLAFALPEIASVTMVTGI